MTSPQLASHLRKMRIATGISQPELARKIGVSPKTINAYEIGYRRVLAIRLCQIVEACGWTMAQFFDGTGQSSRTSRPSDAELDRRAMAMPSWRANADA